MTATKARRLLSLGYAPRTVSRLLGLKPRDVEAFARTRTGRFPAPLSPWYPTARDEAWRHDRDTGPCGEPLEPPPPSNAVEPIEPGAESPAPPPWTCEDGSIRPTRGPRRLSVDEIRQAAALLAQGHSYRSVAVRFKVSVNTLRRYATDPKPRRRAIAYPTESASLKRGTVRWDLPLRTGRRTQVRVDCECGCQRFVDAVKVSRRDKRFTGQCEGCRWTAPPALPRPPIAPYREKHRENRRCSTLASEELASRLLG